MAVGSPLTLAVASPLLTGRAFFVAIATLGVACFAYIVAKRLVPLFRAQRDFRFDRPSLRLQKVVKFWLGQWKQPRYLFAGILHIAIFAGFLALMARSISLVLLGVFPRLQDVNSFGWMSAAYGVLKDYAATLVFVAVVLCAVRRAFFKPTRYAVPVKYGNDHTPEALLVLGLIGTLMISESLFAASQAALQAVIGGSSEKLAPFSLAWIFRSLLPVSSTPLVWINFYSYVVHDLTFFAFLCFLPMGKHFHVITSFFNVYWAKLERGFLKPVKYGVADEQLDQLKSLGVKSFEDFTWKHMLDFYSCADCGRCSDNCPANLAGRPLSPRFLTIKARDYAFKHYPIFGHAGNGESLIATIYSEDEIWSCTTCGACEEECPLMIEYIDKIVDLRRGLIDDGNVPQSLQKPLKALESRGNPYGKLEKKRADWARAKDFAAGCAVKTLDGKNFADTLYFVDSITSFDDRMQSIARATARILDHTRVNFGILGEAEKDSGHEVRRFGEETLFMALRDHNSEAIRATGVERIVTSDPHTYNALKHDYNFAPPVEHISEVVAQAVKSGAVKFKPIEKGLVYTYHDPCYLGRHNQIYDDPRDVLDAIPGIKRVEMKRCHDRSFCCGGGGLMLFYEPKEEERIGVKRVRMAAEAGANVIVTACPFCMANLEDAIKVAGLEDKMTAIDLAELVDQQMTTSCELRASSYEQGSSLVGHSS